MVQSDLESIFIAIHIRKKDNTLKKIRFAFFFTGMAVMLMVPAFAYVDPSVTSMAIQAIAGVVVAAAAVAGVLWSKAKKKAKQVLNIDENAGKTVEEDVVVLTDEDKAEVQQAVSDLKEAVGEVKQTVAAASGEEQN